MKIKILFITPWYPDSFSPVSGIFVHEQARALAREYDVFVLHVGVIGIRSIYQGSHKLSELYGSKFSCKDGVWIYQLQLPWTRYISILSYLQYYFFANIGFGRIKTKWGKPDIIHAHIVLPSGWAAVRLGKRYDIPVVLTEHSGPFEMHLQNDTQKGYAEQTFNGIKKLITVSPSLNNIIKKYHPYNNSITIGNVIPDDFFQKPSSDHLKRGSKLFLSVCILTKNKGINYLLDAVKILQQSGQENFQVVIGGDGPERRSLEQAARENGIGKMIQFVGQLDRNEVIRWIQKCDVFILPSLSETFGVVLAEALAGGKPVIATKCGGPEYFVEQSNGFLVQPADPQQLAVVMEKFLKDEVQFDTVRIKQNIHERFGEKAFLKNISAVYEEVWSGEKG